MEKTKTYEEVFFTAEDLQAGINLFLETAKADPGVTEYTSENYQTELKSYFQMLCMINK